MNSAGPNEVEKFQPVWWAKGPHAQTIFGSLTNRPRRPTTSRSLTVGLADGDSLSVWEDLPIQGPADKAALLLHGLGGDAESSYILSASAALTANGWAVYRLNHRGAGSGVGLSHKMYNSGISSDLPAVIQTIGDLQPDNPLVAVGYSMSGNILLKYLAENDPLNSGTLQGAIAVNPAVDLNACILRLEQLENRLYHNRFLRLLMKQRRLNAKHAGLKIEKIHPRGLREFDALYTAPSWGYDSAEDYYTKCSAAPILGQITTSTILLTSKDDPIVPVSSFETKLSPAINLQLVPAGGHVGYLDRHKTPLSNRRWLDWTVLNLAENFVAKSLSPPIE